jgi:hypothetical protein
MPGIYGGPGFAIQAYDLDTGIITGAAIADGTVTTVELAAGAVTGAKASATLRNKSASRSLPTIAVTGTTEVLLLCPYAGTINGITFAFKEALAKDDTNFLTFAVINKGQLGVGAVAVLKVDNLNTTKLTGGGSVTAYGVRGTLLSTTGSALVVAQYDTLAVQFITAGPLANTLTEGVMLLQIDTQT